jgi:Na+/melibiose symporter-like transporter
VNNTATYNGVPRPLPGRLLLLYCLPYIGYICAVFLYAFYFFKYCTDVLLIAPGILGVLYGLARLWDAAIDPLVGYLSDKTEHALGRRRSWLMVSAPAIVIAWMMLWNPPAFLAGVELVIWMGIALFAYSTAITLFAVPYQALGMELTTAYHDRTRLFAYRYVMSAVGMVLGFAAFFVMGSTGERHYFELSARQVVLAVSVTAAGFWGAAILMTIYGIGEQPHFLGRGGKNISHAYRDVFRNKHAGLILFIHTIQMFSMSSLSLLAVYVLEYVVKLSIEDTVVMMLVFAVPGLFLMPLWVRLSARLGKKNTWILSMVVAGAGFGLFMFVEEGSFYIFLPMAVLIGMGYACYNTLSFSIYADIIDYDEYVSGERKEGAYLAVWYFIFKASSGIAAIVLGFVLQWVGFAPNMEQSDATVFAILLLVGAVPALGNFACAFLFRRFSLDEKTYADIRQALQQRGLDQTRPINAR